MEQLDISRPFSDLIQTLFNHAQDVDLGELGTQLKRLNLVAEMLKKAKENLDHWQSLPSIAEARISTHCDDPNLHDYRELNRSIRSSAFTSPSSPLYGNACGILYRLLTQSFGIVDIQAKEEQMGFSTCIMFIFPNPWFDSSTVEATPPKPPKRQGRQKHR